MIQTADHSTLRNTSLCPGSGGYGRFCSIIILFSAALFLVQPVSGYVTLEYFHQAGCVNCARTDIIVRNIQEQYLDRVSVRDISLDNREGVRLLVSYGRTEIPVIVINHVKVIDEPEITENRIREEIQLAESGAYPVGGSENEDGPLTGPWYLAVFFSYILGIMTGLSPCLLGSLVVIVTGAANAGSAAGRRLYAPVFGAGLVTAYLGVTAGILFAGFHISPGAGFTATIFALAGFISIGFGIFQLGFIRLPAPTASWGMNLFSRFNSLKGAFFLGIIFAILFSPCAGAPFLILIDTLLITGSAMALGMVTAFGSGILTLFLLPWERLVRFGMVVQKASGILLIAFGIWLLMGI